MLIALFHKSVPMGRFLVAALSFVTSMCIAYADQYDSQVLFSKGAWKVEITRVTSGGEFWCSAETLNSRNQILSITAYDDGLVTLFVFDLRWDFPQRPIRFLVDIDNSHWTMEGAANDVSIFVALEDGKKGARLFHEMMEGNAVAVMNADESRLANFSLSGSHAAISKLFECWEKASQTDRF